LREGGKKKKLKIAYRERLWEKGRGKNKRDQPSSCRLLGGGSGEPKFRDSRTETCVSFGGKEKDSKTINLRKTGIDRGGGYGKFRKVYLVEKGGMGTPEHADLRHKARGIKTICCKSGFWR